MIFTIENAAISTVTVKLKFDLHVKFDMHLFV